MKGKKKGKAKKWKKEREKKDRNSLSPTLEILIEYASLGYTSGLTAPEVGVLL